MKRLLVLLLTAALCMTVFTACGRENKTEQTEVSPYTAADYAGEWMDQYSQRAYMGIEETEDGTLSIEIMWGNGASSTWFWDFSASLDPQTGALKYENGVQRSEDYDEDGNMTETIMYSDSTGALTLGEDGVIRWNDSNYENSAYCEFIRPE